MWIFYFINFIFNDFVSATLSKVTRNDAKMVNQGCHALINNDTKKLDKEALTEYLKNLGMDDRAATLRSQALVKVECKL